MSDAPIARIEEDLLIVRASALGNCVRALWASATGYAATSSPDWLIQMAEEGHLHEGAVRDRLREDGYVIEEVQGVMQWEVIPNKVRIEGHVDGMIEGLHQPLPRAILEVKSMSDNVFKEFELNKFTSKPGYAWQVSAYMLGNGVDNALYAYKNRNSGELATFLITTPPIGEGRIQAKMAKLWSYIDQGTMPDCGENINKFFCPFPYLHEEYEDEKVDLSGDEALDELAAEYVEVNNQVKQLEVRKKELRAGLIAMVGTKAKGMTDHHRITVSEKGRAGLNKVLLVNDFGEDVMKKYETRTKWTEVRVTKR